MENTRKLLNELDEENSSIGEIIGYNIKGDETRTFDTLAENNLIDGIKRICEEEGVKATIMAEEGGVEKEGEDYYFIIDPVDGSTNFARDIGLSSISIAVASKPYFENVEMGIVKDIVSGKTWSAIRGRGSFLDGKKISPSKVKILEEAIIGVDLDFTQKKDLKIVYPLLLSVKKIRKIGTDALELSYVASGGYDAFVDVRRVLTPESFAAGKLIIEEAGGIVSDIFGREITGRISLTQAWTVVASGNELLHKKVLEKLAEET